MDLMRVLWWFFFSYKYNVMIFMKIHKRTQVPNLLKTVALTSAQAVQYMANCKACKAFQRRKILKMDY